MEGKKKYVAIVLFLLIGLSLFTFANPADDEKKLKEDGKDSSEVENNDSESNNEDDDNTSEEEKEDDKELDDKKDNSISVDTDDKNNVSSVQKDNSYEKALKAVEVAESTLSLVDSNSARDLVDLVTDTELKAELANRLDAVDAAIDAIKLVEALEKLVNEAENKDDINIAITYRDENGVEKAVSDLTIVDVKNELQTRVDALNKILNDNTAPVVSGVEDGEITKEDVSVLVDEEDVTITVILNGTEIENSDVFTEEGEYVYTVVDAAFNETIVKFTIDKTAPEVISVTTSNKGNSTKEDVTVTVTFNEKVVAVEGWVQVSDTEFTKVYSENGKYTVEFSDVAGNTVDVKFEVKRIDKVEPEVTVITSNNGNPTNGDVTVTIITNEAVYRPSGWTEVKTNKEHEWTNVYSENGTYLVTVKDKAGNETTVEFVVEGIDREAPVYSGLRVIGGNYYKEDGKHIRYATNGTTIYVYTTFTEKLAVNPKVTMNGTWAVSSYLAKESEGAYIYASAFKLNKEDGLEDGEVTIVVEGYADAAGNVGETLTNDDITLSSQKHVIIDKTPVKVTLSDGTLGNDPYRNLNVKLYDANMVTSVVVNGVQLPHTGKYVDINDGDAYTFVEGENVIVAKDKSGNVTEVTYVKDTIAPVIKSMAMSGGNLYKENGKVMWYATNGSYIYVNLQFTEKLAVAPVVKLNGEVVAKLGTVKESGNVVIYSYSYKLNENDGLKDGEVSVEVSGYADNAGNVGVVLTNEDITLASQKYVVIDKTPVKVSLSNGSIGNGQYSKINVKLYDANGVNSVVINGTKLAHTGIYVDINDGDAYTFVEGENVIVAKDKAGNVTEVTYVKDLTAPEIDLVGQEGLNKNEYRVEAGTKVNVDDVMAKAHDNYDEDVLVEIIKVDFLATSAHPERNIYGYDYTNGFDTTTVGRYNITFKATDNAFNTSEKTMLLIIKDTTAPVIIIKGTEGRNNNELRVNQGDVVTLDDVTALSRDIVDGEKTIYPNKITRYYPIETGKASHKYDATNGFDTKTSGYYIIEYVAVDEAGNSSTKSMLLVVKAVSNVGKTETIVLDEDMTLTEVIKVEKGNKTIIDLNGKTLILDGEDTKRLFENEGELIIKNGTVIQKAEDGMGIVDNNGGIVRFDNVHVIDYGSYNHSTISNNGGEVIITNSFFEEQATKGLNSTVSKCVGRYCANTVVDNNGTLTIKNTELKGNSEFAYALVLESGNVVIDDVQINHNRGGLGIYGGTITMTNTDINIPTGSNSYYGIYVANMSNTTLTFNSGNILANRNAILVANGTESGKINITINGGTFNTRTPSKYASVSLSAATSLDITGGTFKNADVSSYLKEEYEQNTNGEVVLKTID